MNPAIWIAIFLPIWISIMVSLNNKKELQKSIIFKQKKKREGLSMSNEVIRNFIGKDCIITTFQTQVNGIIESIEDNWVILRVGNQIEIVNIDYISRIREYPLKKNGKKKMIV
ncbi:MAG: hypothetical protein WBI17_04775 [Clostridiaceae bacterium]